jgi:hypothetical protein
MIVLDEHLPHEELAEAIRQWYRGRVCTITELRPGTIIKDDAVSSLLQSVSEPTFVTLNWSDFWHRTDAHPGFCLVCFTLPSQRAAELPPLLRRLFRCDPFRTKSARMGKVARVGEKQFAYYRVRDPQVYVQPLS